MPQNIPKKHYVTIVGSCAVLLVVLPALAFLPLEVKVENKDVVDAQTEAKAEPAQILVDSTPTSGLDAPTPPAQAEAADASYQPQPDVAGQPVPENSISATAGVSPEWISTIPGAEQTSQMLVVEAVAPNSSEAVLSFHQKDADGTWREEVAGVVARVGAGGVGEASEGVPVTPAGVYALTEAIGIKPAPDTAMPYRQVDESHYWVSDPGSPWYNQLVSTNYVSNFNAELGEHLVDAGAAYDYAIGIGYNTECVPGRGSAFFVHCLSSPEATEGCVAIPKDVVLYILERLRPGALISISCPEAVSADISTDIPADVPADISADVPADVPDDVPAAE